MCRLSSALFQVDYYLCLCSSEHAQIFMQTQASRKPRGCQVEEGKTHLISLSSFLSFFPFIFFVAFAMRVSFFLDGIFTSRTVVFRWFRSSFKTHPVTEWNIIYFSSKCVLVETQSQPNVRCFILLLIELTNTSPRWCMALSLGEKIQGRN